MEKPQIVIDAEKLYNSESTGKITDPKTGKKYFSDYGTIKLIVDLYNNPMVSDSNKEKFFSLPLDKIVNFLWKNASFKR